LDTVHAVIDPGAAGLDELNRAPLPTPCGPYRYTSTGIFECVRTLTVSLPRTTAETPRRPCEAITIKSHFLASAASMDISDRGPDWVVPGTGQCRGKRL